MTTPAPPKQGAPQGQAAKQAPAMAPWPFPVGVLDTQNMSDYDQTKTMSSGTVQFPDVQVQPDGWTRGIWFDINAVCTSNTNTVTFNGDAAAGTGAPFTMINTVLFRDTGGEQIFGPFNGYDWMNTNKFGGYFEVGDPRADYNYSTTTGSATNSGSAHMSLYLPLEISAADSLGDVENRSENSIYRVALTLEQSSVVYGVAPLNLPAVEVKTTQDSYTEPVAAMALSGRPVSEAPPSPGTLQYWKQEDDSGIVANSHSTLITNGIGNGYRNIIFKLIRTSGTRANGTADWPDPQELDLGTTRIRNLYKKTWQDKMVRAYGFTAGSSADVAQGLENGVFVQWFNQDTGLEPGNESRRKYLRTKPGNTFKLRGTYGNAGVLYITSNYIVPKNNDFSKVVR
jgi:hypothetical protein